VFGVSSQQYPSDFLNPVVKNKKEDDICSFKERETNLKIKSWIVPGKIMTFNTLHMLLDYRYF